MTSSIYELIKTFAVFIMLVAFAICDTQADPKPLRIGVILPLSGEVSQVGTAIRNGCELASRELNANGKQIELIFEDDQMQQTKTVNAFQKLSNIDAVQGIIVFSSGSAKAVSPLTEKRRLPLIAIASDASISHGKEYSFNLWVTPETETEVLVPEVIRRGYTNIAMISSEQDGALAIREAFLKTAHGKFSVKLDERYPLMEKDFKIFLAKARQKNDIDAILINLMPGQIGLFTRQARELGLKQPFFGYENFEVEDEVKVSQGAMIGAWYAVSGKQSDEFLNKYKAAYPDSPVIVSDNGYDAVKLLAKAYAQGKTPSGAVNLLHHLRDYHGALGTYSATNDNRFTLPASLRIVTNEGFRNLH